MGARSPPGRRAEPGSRCEIVDGGVVESLVAVGRGHDVAALVLGTREEYTADKPLGSTALAVVGGVEKPIVLIPPRAAPLERIRRVLAAARGHAQDVAGSGVPCSKSQTMPRST